jgi:hypothetical protein
MPYPGFSALSWFSNPYPGFFSFSWIPRVSRFWSLATHTTMAAESRRAAVSAAIEQRMRHPTTTSRDRRLHFRKLEDDASNICARMREHIKKFPGSPLV